MNTGREGGRVRRMGLAGYHRILPTTTTTATSAHTRSRRRRRGTPGRARRRRQRHINTCTHTHGTSAGSLSLWPSPHVPSRLRETFLAATTAYNPPAAVFRCSWRLLLLLLLLGAVFSFFRLSFGRLAAHHARSAPPFGSQNVKRSTRERRRGSGGDTRAAAHVFSLLSAHGAIAACRFRS